MAEEVLEQPGELITSDGELKGLAAILKPAGFIFMPLAILLDLTGIILLCFGLDDFWITDIIGLITIGFWTYFNSQTAKVTHGAKERLTKLTKTARRLRWLRPLLIILEFIPYVGAAPCWIIIVYFELQN
jgi:hypothetical protein